MVNLYGKRTKNQCLVYIVFLVTIVSLYLQINQLNPCKLLSEQIEALEDKVDEREDNNMQLESELSGIGIVQKAYQQTFGLTSCASTISEKNCLKKLSRTDGLPWWFRNMLRDVMGLRMFWSDMCTNGASLCAIEKIGYTQWHNIICSTNNLPGKTKNCTRPVLPHKQCQKQPKFVFLRDPLERFLSAYMDKCERKMYQHHCAPLAVFGDHKGEGRLVQNMSKQMRFETYVDTMPLRWDMHFFPQSTQCNGLRRHLDEYAFVGKMDDNFYRDVEEVSNRFPAIANATEKVFQLKANAGKLSVGTETKSKTYILEYYTSNTVRKVLQYYAVDYVELGLTIPQWAIDMLA